MRLVFASQNKHKLLEIKALLPPAVGLLSLPDLYFHEDIPETSPTLVGNALQKANFIYDRFQVPCFADDTGLEVEALDGRPGVYSARYAGEGKTADDNITKLLLELKGQANRFALFKTVIAFVGIGEPTLFEGILEGNITLDKKGSNGFGYDPVFMPAGYSITLAEMSTGEKNKLSHRAIAVKKFVEHLSILSL